MRLSEDEARRPFRSGPAVRVERLARRFGAHLVLRRVSFELAWGEAVAVLGANGAGKTTLLRILAGALTPSRGTVSVQGCCPARATDRIRAYTAFLAGDAYLYDDLTARENLDFALRMGGCDATARRVGEVLERLGVERVADRRVRFFSSGMRKRLALARVVALDPAILLLDEPYASLDEGATRLVDAIVEEWRARGRVVLVATHLGDRAREVCDRVLHLVDGTVLAGPTSQPAELGTTLAGVVG